MDDKEILKIIAAQIDDLEKQGLIDSEEYEKLSDDYQSIAQNLVLSELFKDDDEQDFI